MRLRTPIPPLAERSDAPSCTHFSPLHFSIPPLVLGLLRASHTDPHAPGRTRLGLTLHYTLFWSVLRRTLAVIHWDWPLRECAPWRKRVLFVGGMRGLCTDLQATRETSSEELVSARYGELMKG